jgi:hypothetical protein
MADVTDWITGPKPRHNFYCFTTHCFNQAELIFVLMVQQFRGDRKDKQAQLIADWFLAENIPESLREGDYLQDLNVPGDVKSQFTSIQQKATGSKPGADTFDPIDKAVRANLSSAASNRNYVNDKNVFSQSLLNKTMIKLKSLDDFVTSNLKNISTDKSSWSEQQKQANSKRMKYKNIKDASYQSSFTYLPTSESKKMVVLLRQYLKLVGDFNADAMGMW